MADEGASPRELVLEACRRNNTDLLQEVLDTLTKTHGSKAAPGQIAQLLNTARDGIGNGVLHLAATHGNYEILDILLDQEGLEIDEPSRMEKDTPLHKAVRYCNSLDKAEWEHGLTIVDILLDAGCDPRIRNSAKLKPLELADPRNEPLRASLRKAEYGFTAGGDVVVDEEDEEEAGVRGKGSGSESD
ncbi:ankyrin repeat domain-containing protein [Tothia fuscella]|uniref:Ankyrin repeat domain-containing protein n=1 Tax=Tothia fuscella TaxID=1048955 RepID=A0A9P4NX46_9PEZI|nr:ankyrin repeat domain-containing protein [Tothia fuscella]